MVLSLHFYSLERLLKKKTAACCVGKEEQDPVVKRPLFLGAPEKRNFLNNSNIKHKHSKSSTAAAAAAEVSSCVGTARVESCWRYGYRKTDDGEHGKGPVRSLR